MCVLHRRRQTDETREFFLSINILGYCSLVCVCMNRGGVTLFDGEKDFDDCQKGNERVPSVFFFLFFNSRHTLGGLMLVKSEKNSNQPRYIHKTRTVYEWIDIYPDIVATFFFFFFSSKSIIT